MKIREALEKDFEVISMLYWESDNFHFQNQPNIYDETKDSFRSFEYLKGLINDQNSLFYVIEDENSVLGFIYGYEERKGFLPFHKKRTYFVIDNIIVSKKKQRLGYGTKLIDKIVEECKQKNYSDIVLNVFSFNKQAIALYKKKGFCELSKEYIMEL